MDEEASSWIRRAKFSHTVCHRLDSSRLASIPITLQTDRLSGLKSRPSAAPASTPAPAQAQAQVQAQATSNKKSISSSYFSQTKRHPLTNKPRSISPHPETQLSDTFKEAQSERKRFSTPGPRRSHSDKGLKGKFFHRDSQSSRGSNSNASPLRHLASLINDKSKNRKDSPWSKYFDPNSGRVTAVEAADEWSVDLSKLFLGNKFAHGAHSRLYHGVYTGESVAVKIIRVPDEDESGALAARLEKQFISEVTLLSRLDHPNVIKVIRTHPFLTTPFVYFVV